MPADIVGHVSALHLATVTEELGERRSHEPYGLSYALAEEAGAMHQDGGRVTGNGREVITAGESWTVTHGLTIS